MTEIRYFHVRCTYSACFFDRRLAWYYLCILCISAGSAGICMLMSVCLTMVLIYWSPDFTCLAETMCTATERMQLKGVKWNIQWRMLIDDFIMWEQKWPEKARVMMYCLMIHWSSIWIQTTAFISPHLYACECFVSEHSLVSRLEEEDWWVHIWCVACPPALSQSPGIHSMGNDDEGSLDKSILLHDGKR